MGLFTGPEPGSGSAHKELVAFARAHCEGLLAQGGPRAVDTESFTSTVVQRIAGWVERARQWREALVPPPEESEDIQERAAWVASWVGVTDPAVAVELAEEMDGSTPPVQAAARIWAEVEAWPQPGPGAV